MEMTKLEIDRNVAMMGNPVRWPIENILPIRRVFNSEDGFPSHAVMINIEKLTHVVIGVMLYDELLRYKIAEVVAAILNQLDTEIYYRAYDSYEDIVKDGWVVD